MSRNFGLPHRDLLDVADLHEPDGDDRDPSGIAAAFALVGILGAIVGGLIVFWVMVLV